MQKHGKDSPQAAEERVNFRALKLEDYVRKALAEAPPMSDAQRERIDRAAALGCFRRPPWWPAVATPPTSPTVTTGPHLENLPPYTPPPPPRKCRL